MLRRLGPRGLRGQILLWSLLPTMLILALVAYFSFWAYSRVTEALVEDRNRELSRLLAGQMSLELGEYTDLLGDLRDAHAAQGGSAMAWSAFLTDPDLDLRAFDRGVVVLNSKGIVIAADPRGQDALGEDWSKHTYFRRMLESPAPLLLSNVELNGPHGPVVGVAIAMLGPRGGLQEALVGLISVNAHGSSPFYRGLLRLSLRESSRLTLVDSKGVAIYHTVPALIGRSVLSEPAVMVALEGESGALRSLDMDGQQVIASYAPVPGTSCYVVEQESWAELSAVSMGYGRWLIGILVLALVIPGVVVRTALNRITRPIRRLTNAADAMSRGEMHQIVDKPAAQELSELATAFNRMASQLQTLYASLESRVRARTRELSAMNAIAGVVSASLDLHEILDAALGKVLELMAMDGGTAYRLSAGGEMLILMAQRGRMTEGLPAQRHLPLEMLTTGEIVSQGAIALSVESLPDNELWQTARREGWRQLVLMPLESKDELLGLIALFSFTPRRVPHNELALLTAIGSQIGVAVENGRLYQEAGRLAAMAERNRLAQDLHDSVTQTIFTASLLAGVIPLLWDKDPEDARRQLEEVARLTRGALEEMRALLLELRPATLAQVPLEELLKRLANSTESNARLTVMLDANAGLPLPAQVRVSLYRIAQEALNNVVKHANANQVWITLRPVFCDAAGESRANQVESIESDEPCGVEMAIRDDGQGFELEAVEGEHLGLAIMRERAEDIHARLTLVTGPGQGTLIGVVWRPRSATGLPVEDAATDSYEAYVAYQRERASWRISADEGEGVMYGDDSDDPGGSIYG